MMHPLQPNLISIRRQKSKLYIADISFFVSLDVLMRRTDFLNVFRFKIKTFTKYT